MTDIATNGATPPPVVQNVLDRLTNVVMRPTGRAWRAPCPVERTDIDHQNEQVQVTLARDGHVMLDCPGGCSLDQICESIGVTPAELWPGNDAPTLELHTGDPLPPAIRAIDAPPPKPIEWIVEDLFTAGEIGLVVGDGGSFKSTAVIDMAAAIAGGYQVFERFHAPQRPTLIISGEDSIDVVMMRLNAFCVGHQWDRERVLSNVHLFATTDATLSSITWQNHITSEAKRVGAGLIILDPFAELITGDENSNSDIRPTIKFLRQLGRDTDAAVVIVHHAGKQGQDKRALDRIRGASALPSASRSILFFDFSPNGPGVAVEHLKMSRAPRLDRFILTRNVESEPGNKAQWRSASLAYVDAKSAALGRAETFILAQITASPRHHTTASLRKEASRNGYRNEDVALALQQLQESGAIGFETGARNSRKWFPL